MKRNAFWFSVAFLATLGTFFSCVPQPVPFFGGGAIVVQFIPVFDGEEIEDFDNIKEYDFDGNKITFGDFKFYIANIVLEDENGDFTDLSELRLIEFENIESRSLIIDNIPVGNYRSVQFDLGVPASENAKTWDPNAYGGGHPLNDELMFSQDLQSFKFMVLNGFVEDGGRKPFTYNPGENRLFQNDKIIDSNISLTSELAATIDIEVDLNKVLNGIEVLNEPKITSGPNGNNLILGANLMRNLSKAIKEKQ